MIISSGLSLLYKYILNYYSIWGTLVCWHINVCSGEKKHENNCKQTIKRHKDYFCNETNVRYNVDCQLSRHHLPSVVFFRSGSEMNGLWIHPMSPSVPTHYICQIDLKGTTEVRDYRSINHFIIVNRQPLA